MYSVSGLPELISRVTGAVVEELQDWQERSLHPVCPVVFLDAIRVRIRDVGIVRNKAVHLALSIRKDGSKEVLGLWIGQNEDSNFRLRVMNDLGGRGLRDILIAVIDGVKGQRTGHTLLLTFRKSGNFLWVRGLSIQIRLATVADPLAGSHLTRQPPPGPGGQIRFERAGP